MGFQESYVFCNSSPQRMMLLQIVAEIPVKVFPHVWITRARDIRVNHDLSKNNNKKGSNLERRRGKRNFKVTRVKKDLMSSP